MGVMQTSLCHGPVYFNVYPNLSLSLTDPNILKAATLNLKTHGYNFMPGSETIAVIFRIHYKVLNTLAPKAKNITKPGRTVLVETNLLSSNIATNKIIKWDEINFPQNWLLTSSVPFMNPYPYHHGTTKKINQKGIDYYNKVIDKLLENGITPFVTLFHWDVPQHLEEAYGGFRSRQIVDHFVEFVKICYKEFGNRVKHWITLNEPWTFSCMGYSLGRHAPGRCTPGLFQYPESCPAGDSSTEPYIVTHNLILAHAKAARLYKDHFQATQGGNVGITLVSLWFIPLTESPQDKDAATRSLEFMLGWFMDPLTTGDYPFSMRAIVKERLPYFTNEEKDMIKGSFDFIGINYYSSRYVTPLSYQPPFAILDSFAEQREKNKDGVPIGELHGSWIYVVPDGIKELLLYIKERYNDPKIYITENGTAEKDDPEQPMDKAIHDEHRIEYMSAHLAQVRQAMREGADVQGYFGWSIKDNFEWNEGYIERFGLNYVDYNDDLKRYPKSSFKFYNKFLHS